MDGIVALEVAIGLTFMFFLLSLVASGLGEYISRMLTLRAKTLREGIRSLIVGEDDGKLTGIVYGHPAIASLSKASPTGGKEITGKVKKFLSVFKREPGPSAIPPKRLANALVEIILDDNPDIIVSKELRKIRQTLTPATGTQPATPPAGGATSTAEPKSQALAPATAARISIPGHMQRQVDSIVRSIEREGIDAAMRYVEFRKRLEDWYNESMDRVSGWYKRKLQLILLGIGAVLAIALNVNVFTVATGLWTNDAHREAIVLQAQEANDQIDDGKAQELIDDLPIPIGWTSEAGDPRQVTWENWFGDGSGRLAWYHILGWAFTAAAIALGAPFWFDLMNKFIDVRGGGKDASREREKEGQQPETAKSPG